MKDNQMTHETEKPTEWSPKPGDFVAHKIWKSTKMIVVRLTEHRRLWGRPPLNQEAQCRFADKDGVIRLEWWYVAELEPWSEK